MGHIVTIHPDGGQAKVIRLEVVNDRIIRVRATSKDDLPQKMQSLMIVPQQVPAKNSYTITETPESIEVIAKQVRAVVSKATGEVCFYDGLGKTLLLKESGNGKQFWDFTVPERELGLKGGVQPTEAQLHGLTWQM
jgi:alpha-D-xyloside xylohydrolase